MKSELSTLSPKELAIKQYGTHELDIGYTSWFRFIQTRRKMIDGSEKELMTGRNGSRFFAGIMKDQGGHTQIRIMELDVDGNAHSILLEPEDSLQFIEGLMEAHRTFELLATHKKCQNFFWIPYRKFPDQPRPDYYRCSVCGAVKP